MHTQLNKRIMRRVHLIYLVRQALQPALVRCYILVALLWQTNVHVSLRNVWKNFSAQPVGEAHTFVIKTFTHTETVVQIVTVGLVIVGMWLAWDFIRRWQPSAASYQQIA